MVFNTDHYFHIGHSHLNSGKPCQDYAISGIYDKAAFAIVADGCSTAGNTDVGARIVALSVASAIRNYWIINRKVSEESVPFEISLEQKMLLSGIRTSLDLNTRDMFATCMYAYLSEQGGIIQSQGDGVVAIKRLDGTLEAVRFDWQRNMPFYPAYMEMDINSFISAHGNDLEAEVLVKTTVVFSADGEIREKKEAKLTLRQGIKGPVIRLQRTDDIDFVAVFTDGVVQIENVDWKDSVLQLLAFKNFAGEFLKRRMIRGIKDFQADGKKGPMDDISCAIIRITHEEGGEKNGA